MNTGLSVRRYRIGCFGWKSAGNGDIGSEPDPAWVEAEKMASPLNRASSPQQGTQREAGMKTCQTYRGPILCSGREIREKAKGKRAEVRRSSKAASRFGRVAFFRKGYGAAKREKGRLRSGTIKGRRRPEAALNRNREQAETVRVVPACSVHFSRSSEPGYHDPMSEGLACIARAALVYPEMM